MTVDVNDPAVKARIIELRLKPMNMQAVADVVGVTRNDVSRITRHLNLKPVRSRQVDHAAILALAAQGMSRNGIAKKLGLPRTTVRDIVNGKRGDAAPPSGNNTALTGEDLAEIERLRVEGHPPKAIAKAYLISKPYVSLLTSHAMRQAA